MKSLKSFRVMFFIAVMLISLMLITNITKKNPTKPIGFGEGLDYGIDFAGGTQMQLKLDEPVSSDIMAIEKSIIESRLNSMGLKDIPVRPWGDQYLLIQIAQATPEETQQIETILKQQAKFEERIDGELTIKGDEIEVDLGPQGTELYPLSGGYSWAVSVSHSQEGACRFGKVADGKRGRPVDIFIDRPENTAIIFSPGDWMILENLTDVSETDRFFFEDTAIEVIQNRAKVPALSLSSSTSSYEQIDKLKEEGVTKLILAADHVGISDEIRNILEERGFDTVRRPQENMSPQLWIQDLVGLKSSPRLDFDTRGECVYNARITGSAPSFELGLAEVQENQVLLTSGNLPVKLTVESKSTTPPTLGHKFLAYSFYTALIAVFAVALIIFIRYKKIEILLPLIFVMVGDILIILGFASLVNWELDLPALAGIIAAVGTGVDHLVIITDETLKKGKEKKLVSMAERVRKAFFIIFTAAATITAAMAPLIIIGAGMLRGFAFTTLMGVFIGVLISRPAYAKIIEDVLKNKKIGE